MGETIRYINENTSLPFKVVVPVIATIFAGTLWIQSTLADIRRSQREAITRDEVSEWRNRLADRNRSLDVPYLEAPQRR